ncbi:MAG: DUF2662 domain-containing protein [Chloroflexi bacterium]|nr:DUF2662 domain-containing protein [Chloroflexota bacterium]
MNALARLESLLESVVEGPFRRLFGGRLDPVHLARRLAQSMDDHQMITWNLPVVPNRYSLFLSVGDFGALSKFQGSLESELARYVRERAAEKGFHLYGMPSVTIHVDDHQSSGSCRVEVATVDPVTGVQSSGVLPTSPEGPSPRNSEVFDEMADGGTRVIPTLKRRQVPVLVSGIEIVWVAPDGSTGSFTARLGQSVAIGRMPVGNDLVIPHESISKHHATLRVVESVDGHGFDAEIEDLGSTNGLEVNGNRVSAAMIVSGSTIRLGEVEVTMAATATP